MKARWAEPDVRDEVIDYIHYWSDRTEIKAVKMISWIGISRSKFYDWQCRYGKVNEHNGLILRDYWLTDYERQAIVNYYKDNILEGYRRLTYMMMDADIVAVSPSSVYRVLFEAGLLGRWNRKVSKKGNGFTHPLKPHEHWHIDVSYVNICGTDGFSRYIVEWDIRESMTEKDVEIILQRAKEKFPNASPRIISDNGPQFIAKDFKEFIRISGMTHVKTSPYYPQSNGKLERYHRTIKGDCIRVQTPLSLADAKRLVMEFVEYYNNVRLHSAIGYITPKDKLDGRADMVFAMRDNKLAAAREARKAMRKAS